MERDVFNYQKEHWDEAFTKNKDMFGNNPSHAAVRAATIFKEHGLTHILELGAGQGRDSIYFAQNGFHVHVLDYSQEGIENIRDKSIELGLADRITVGQHDVRQPFPFEENQFDGCYSHMLFCMALTTDELLQLSGQIRHVVKPGGLNIYTARNQSDPHFGQGIHRGEDMYEVGGFIVHFFDEEKVAKLAVGYQVMDIEQFEEGGLPRRLFQVTMQKAIS